MIGIASFAYMFDFELSKQAQRTKQIELDPYPLTSVEAKATQVERLIVFSTSLFFAFSLKTFESLFCPRQTPTNLTNLNN